MDPRHHDLAPRRIRTSWEGGLGVLCPEGQADGVPCFELGADCMCCDRAVVFTPTASRPRRPRVMESLAPDLR